MVLRDDGEQEEMKHCEYCGLTLWSLFDKYHFRCWYLKKITDIGESLVSQRDELVGLGNELRRYYEHT